MADFSQDANPETLGRGTGLASDGPIYPWPSHGRVAGLDLVIGEIGGPDSAQRPVGKYAPRQQRLLWIVAALVLVQLVMDITLGFAPRQPANQAFLEKIMILQVITGTLIFGLMVVRWRVRRAFGAPASPLGSPYDFALLARINHYGFYALLLTLPVVGWLAYAASVRAASMLGGLHGALAFTLILAICVHLAGVAYHTFIHRDGLLDRMTR